MILFIFLGSSKCEDIRASREIQLSMLHADGITIIKSDTQHYKNVFDRKLTGSSEDFTVTSTDALICNVLICMNKGEHVSVC